MLTKPPVFTVPSSTVRVEDPLRLTHLPLVMDVFRRLGMPAIIDDQVTSDRRLQVPVSQCVAVIICGVFVGAHSLWRLRERLAPYDMKTILQDPAFELRQFTDERLGAALDALYVGGLDAIMTAVALGVINRFQIGTRFLHFDTTSLSFYGGFEREDPFADVEGIEPPPKVVLGYSKAHRPDLKQVIFGSLVSEDGGVPLMGKVLNGNMADGTAAGLFFSRIRELVQNPSEVCCVADSKGWCGPVLARCEADQLRLLSRLPRNQVLHRDILAKPQEGGHVLMVREGTPQADQYTYWGFDAIDTHTLIEKAADGTETKKLLTVPVRALRVHSTALERTKRKTMEKERVREQKKAEKMICAWGQMTYACETDAKRAADRLIGQQSFDTITLTAALHHHEGAAKRGRGRPPKNYQSEPPLDAKEHWKASFSIVPVDANLLSQQITVASTYVLIRTKRDGWDLSDADMITHYKLQHHVERGFSWLKSGAEINPMFLHTPHRIAALGMIYCVGLVIHNLIQRNIRKFLTENQRGLPYHKGKKSNRITTRFVFELMSKVQTITLHHPDGTRERRTIGYAGWPQLAAQALGTQDAAFIPVD